MSKLTRCYAALAALMLPMGCNAMFDIERGTPAGAAGDGGMAGSGGNGGFGGSAGSSAGTGGTSGSGANGSGGNTVSTSGGGNTVSTSGGGGSVSSGGNAGGSSTGTASSGGSTGNAGATSGTDATGGTAGSAGASMVDPISCACSSTTPEDDSLVEDFEDGDGALLPRGGRQGGFYGYPDEHAANAHLDCGTGQDGNCIALCIEGVLDGSNYPYAGLGVTLLGTEEGATPYDVASFAGISFKLKGNIPANTQLRAEFPTALTHPPSRGGTCTGDGCFDHYKVTIPTPASETSFEQYEVRFVNLGQGNGGGAWTLNWDGAAEAIWDPSELLNINWQVSSTLESLSSAPFSFCIDDVRLLEPVTAQLVASWDFETDILDVGNVSSNVTVNQASDISAVGQYSLQADIQTGGFACSPWECAALDETQCAETNGCFPINRATFGLNDTRNPIDIQPGDTISFWFYLPEGDIQWINVFLASTDDFVWSVLPLAFPAKRNDWYHAEFTVPDGTQAPVHEWGIEVGAASSFTGSVYVDDMSIHRP